MEDFSMRRFNVNILVVLLGIVTIIIGVTIIPSTHVYSFYFLGRLLKVSQKSLSFFTIIDGFFITIAGYALKSKGRGTWRGIVTALVVTLFILSLSSLRHYDITWIGIALALLILAILVRDRKEYVYPSFSLGRPEIAVAVIAIVFTVSYGIGGSLLLGNQFTPPIRNVETALYFTGEAVTTLGLGDILPVTFTSRMFTISLSVLGIGIFFGAMAIIITPIIERRIGGIVMRIGERQLKSLKNYILVLGYSDFVHGYITKVKNDGLVTVVVLRDQQIAERLKTEGFVVLNQSADDETTLNSFRLENAQRILISSDDDGYNLLIVAALNQIPQQENFKEKVTVLVSNNKNINKFKVFGYDIADISSVISTYLGSNQKA